MPVITIRSKHGSGSSEIGQLIAQKLRIDYVDQKIIADVAELLRTSSQSIADKEMPPSSFLGRIAETMGSTAIFDSDLQDIYLPMLEIPLDNNHYLSGLQHVIKKMAECQSIVIRGRGAQFILKDFPDVFHVMVVAPMNVRVKSVMESMKTDKNTARDEITRFDNGMHNFFKRYFNADADDPVYYDLVINSGNFSVQAAASIVVDALSLKDKIAGIQS